MRDIWFSYTRTARCIIVACALALGVAIYFYPALLWLLAVGAFAIVMAGG